MTYWLLKSEPETFGIEHLLKLPKQITPWDGVRNYQARNFMCEMKKGEQGFFYHSSCAIPGITGIIEVIKEGYPDDTQFDPNSQYYDSKSTYEKPRWFRVDVKLVERFDQMITLEMLRHNSKLSDLIILKRGNRLSVTPVTTKDWNEIIRMHRKNK